MSPSKRRISSACGSCKRAKCRCSGPPAPCQTCQSKNRECLFDSTSDGRRKDAAETALEQIQVKHRALESLFNCLRTSSEAVVVSVVDAIRNGSSLPELERLVEDNKVEADDMEEEEEEQHMDIEPHIGVPVGLVEESPAGPSRGSASGAK